MKKIGILTVYHENYNFGGLLQAYALPIALQKYFLLSAEQIDYQYAPPYNSNGHLFEQPFHIQTFLYRCGICFFAFLLNPHLTKRKAAMDQFIKDIPHSNKTYQYNSIKDCLKDYDAYICGGDQIWNDECQTFTGQENLQIFTLQFAPSSKCKLSYAPSMAILSVSPTFQALLKKGLQNLNARKTFSATYSTSHQETNSRCC